MKIQYIEALKEALDLIQIVNNQLIHVIDYDEFYFDNDNIRSFLKDVELVENISDRNIIENPSQNAYYYIKNINEIHKWSSFEWTKISLDSIASKVYYDNSYSQLNTNNIQGAIDIIKETIGDIDNIVDNIIKLQNSYIGGGNL